MKTKTRDVAIQTCSPPSPRPALSRSLSEPASASEDHLEAAQPAASSFAPGESIEPVAADGAAAGAGPELANEMTGDGMITSAVQAMAAARSVLGDGSLSGSCLALERAIGGLLTSWAVSTHVMLLRRAKPGFAAAEALAEVAPAASPRHSVFHTPSRSLCHFELVSIRGDLTLPVQLENGLDACLQEAGAPSQGLLGEALALPVTAPPLVSTNPRLDPRFSSRVDARLLLSACEPPAALLLAPLRDASGTLIGAVSARGRSTSPPQAHQVEVVGLACSLCGLHLGHTLHHLRATRHIAAALDRRSDAVGEEAQPDVAPWACDAGGTGGQRETGQGDGHGCSDARDMVPPLDEPAAPPEVFRRIEAAVAKERVRLAAEAGAPPHVPLTAVCHGSGAAAKDGEMEVASGAAVPAGAVDKPKSGGVIPLDGMMLVEYVVGERRHSRPTHPAIRPSARYTQTGKRERLARIRTQLSVLAAVGRDEDQRPGHGPPARGRAGLLAALREVSLGLSRAAGLLVLLRSLVDDCVALAGATHGSLWVAAGARLDGAANAKLGSRPQLSMAVESPSSRPTSLGDAGRPTVPLGIGVVGRAALGGGSVRVDLLASAEWREALVEQQSLLGGRGLASARSLLCVPLRESVVAPAAVLLLLRHEPAFHAAARQRSGAAACKPSGAFTADEQAAVECLARHAGLILDALLFQEQTEVAIGELGTELDKLMTRWRPHRGLSGHD